MATYKYSKLLEHSEHPAFDKIHEPGDPAPASGIYRCPGCGREATCNKRNPLPPQNHHQHEVNQGKIRWQLIVAHQAK